MPKKSAGARGGAQRHKPKVQKSFEVVRQPGSLQESEIENAGDGEPAMATATATMVTDEGTQPSTSTTPVQPVNAPAGSAAARLASRRQAAQRNQQRVAASLITPEHYAYVKRDLMLIGILATIMVVVLVALLFVPGIGFLNG